MEKGIKGIIAEFMLAPHDFEFAFFRRQAAHELHIIFGEAKTEKNPALIIWHFACIDAPNAFPRHW